MHKAYKIVLIAAMAFSPATAIADQNAERERSALARLAAEIDLLEPLVDSAERQAGHEARFAFDYDALRSTLNRHDPSDRSLSRDPAASTAQPGG